MDRLLLGELWDEIRRMTRKARRVQAAIAYFSGDTHIRLRAGDLLIVNASRAAIRNGETIHPS